MSTLAWIIVSGALMSALALVGSVTLVLPPKVFQRIILPLVALAAGTLLGGALFHMLPASIEALGNGVAVYGGVALGFVSFLVLEQFLHLHHCHRATGAHRPVGHLILLDVEVQFPLIEDISMDIARQYGMIQPGEATTQAVRAVFIVDPEGILRTMLYYPLSAGRNMQEILRVIKALQVADEFNVATPADWVPGERVIVPTAGSCGQAKERMEGDMEGVECVDWFFCTKDIPEADINAALATDPDVVLGRTPES